MMHVPLAIRMETLPGSVETRGESSTAAASERMPYCDMGCLPFSQANALEASDERHTIAQDSSFISGHKKEQVVLDFESSSVLMSLVDGSESYTEFITQKKRHSGVQKRYGKRRTTSRRILVLLAVTDDIGSSNASSRGKISHGFSFLPQAEGKLPP
uniref:Uncharacterized protein n=1 Tax=Tanacetum cinerariifolium TaxID=118510 RepID=A0A6L2KJQ1_TANCI|nr:hypothetical protein [Tanacetum cinerariifolium]